MSTEERAQLAADLHAAKQEQNRCMGGVDPHGCIAASQEIARLRLLLRDDTALFAHFQAIASAPIVKRSKRRAA